MLYSFFATLFFSTLVLSRGGSSSDSSRHRSLADDCYEIYSIYDSFTSSLNSVYNTTEAERLELLQEFQEAVEDISILEEPYSEFYVTSTGFAQGTWNTTEQYLDTETGYYASLYQARTDNLVNFEQIFIGYYENYDVIEEEEDSVRLLVRESYVAQNNGPISLINRYQKTYPQCILDGDDLKYVIRSATSDPYSFIETQFEFDLRRLSAENAASLKLRRP
jgi:hypothetical protein